MADGFAKLKKDLVFHEKRLQLLLSNRVVDDLGACLQEKTQVRLECSADCLDARLKFERAASDPKLSGRWDELKVANLFHLEVPLRFVVGSVKFEAPEGQDTDLLEELIKKLDEIGQRYPEFQHPNARRDTDAFIKMVRDVKFTGRDVIRMRDAVSSKLQVIGELDDLTAVLQESGFALTKYRSEVELCRQRDADARAAGEIAVSEDAIRQKIAILEKMIDTTFFQVHTIESTIETNVTRRQSNVSQFQSTTAMLDCIRNEKAELSNQCVADLGRIERGMAFEAGAKDSGRGKIIELQRQSSERLAALESRQQQLAARLKALFDEFTEVEQALQEVGQQRAAAIASHVELIEGSRHATSDFMELSKYADLYKTNLQTTKQQYDDGHCAIELLERVLLQQSDFSTYDFNASGNRLQAMRRRVCQELNSALNALEEGVAELVHRREAQLRTIAESYEKAFCEMEMRKEMLDPMAKKHVLRVRELEDARTKLEVEIQELNDIAARQRAHCYDTIRKHLADEEITVVDEVIEARALQSREAIVDLRQSIAEVKESAPEMELVAAQSTVVRVAQTGNPVALPPKTASDSSNRSAVVTSMKQRSSRVTAVRDEIAKALETPHSRRSTPALTENGGPNASRSEAANSSSGNTAGGQDSTTTPQPVARRPVRVIPTSTTSATQPCGDDASAA